MTDAKHHPDDDSRFAPPPDADPPIPDTDDDTPPADALSGVGDDPFAPAAPAPSVVDAPIAEADDESEALPLAYAEPDFDPEATVSLGATAPIRITPADEYNTPNLDIDGALAAVSGLDDMLAQQEAEEHAEEERMEREYREEMARLEAEERARLEAEEAERRQLEAEDAARAEAEARVRDLVERKLPAPPPLELGRGSIASVLPGLALVGAGVWLTVRFTTDAAPPPLMVVGALAGVAGLALVSAWLGAGRWYRGGLFLVLWGALSVGAVAYAVGEFGVTLAPAALLAALGAALLLAGVLARPASARYTLAGIGLLVAAAVTAAVSLGYVPAPVMQAAATLWLPVAVLVAVLLVLPLVRALRR